MKNSKNSTIREFFGRLLLKSTQLFRKMWTRILPRSARVIDGDARLHLFPEKKIIYVEVPKAGCSSIKVALKKIGVTGTVQSTVLFMFGFITLV
jgi:hypothetical protein